MHSWIHYLNKFSQPQSRDVKKADRRRRQSVKIAHAAVRLNWGCLRWWASCKSASHSRRLLHLTLVECHTLLDSSCRCFDIYLIDITHSLSRSFLLPQSARAGWLAHTRGARQTSPGREKKLMFPAPLATPHAFKRKGGQGMLSSTGTSKNS